MKAIKPASLAKIDFMYYPFATHNRNLIFRLIAVLFIILSAVAHFPVSVWGDDDKDYARQFRHLGLEAQMQGEFGKALFYYSRAAAYLPKDPTIQNDLGLMYEQLGKWDQAEACYRVAIERDIRYLPAYSNLGMLFKKQARYELAVMYFQRRIDLGGVSDPWMMNAQEELEDIYDRAPYLKNKRTLESAFELERQIAGKRSADRSAKARKKMISYELSMKKGLEDFKAGDYAAAISSFEDALRVYPDSAEAVHSLKRARVQARTERIADSLRASARENRPLFIDRELDTAESVSAAEPPEEGEE